MDVEDIVRRLYATWESGDRATMDALLADDFHFSSPRDDRIDKAKWFEVCWANREEVDGFVLEEIFAKGNEVFVKYVARRKRDGVRFRNVEFVRLSGERIAEVQVYFGRDLA